jgi:hypothetical protein
MAAEIGSSDGDGGGTVAQTYEDAKAHELAEACIALVARRGTKRRDNDGGMLTTPRDGTALTTPRDGGGGGSDDDADDPLAWQRLSLWVDKSCIPQRDPVVKARCVASIEHFLRLSETCIVLLSWSYFTRLWCVYEWACFLVAHKPTDVHVGLKSFISVPTLPLFLAAVRGISVANAQCFAESDRATLVTKVDEYYVGAAAFERFVKVTAIALIARDMMEFATDASDEEVWVAPWTELAADLRFDALVCALGRATPCAWHHEQGYGTPGFWRAVEAWFEADVVPLLAAEKTRAVRRSPRPAAPGGGGDIPEPVHGPSGGGAVVDGAQPSATARASSWRCWRANRRAKRYTVDDAVVQVNVCKKSRAKSRAKRHERVCVIRQAGVCG